MAQQEHTQELLFTITVRTSDGEAHQHNYPITLPLDEATVENINNLQEEIASSFEGNGKEGIAFDYPPVWYRNSHVISIAIATGEMPVDTRRIGFDQPR